MRSLVFLLFFSFIFFSSFHFAVAQRIDNQNHTAREEKEGKTIWDKLQSKQIECKNLTDDNFESLGEYFMGQSVGNTQRHAAMNQMMTSMIGEEGEKQMHIIMGKKLSGCNSNAQIPSGGFGFMPMMFLLRQGFGGQGMMGGWGGFGFLISLFWIILLVDLILLGIWLWKKIKKEK